MQSVEAADYNASLTPFYKHQGKYRRWYITVKKLRNLHNSARVTIELYIETINYIKVQFLLLSKLALVFYI